MKRRAIGLKPSVIIASLLAIFVLLSTTAYFLGVTVNAQAPPNIVAPTVSGAIDTSSPGTEAFWSQLTPAQIQLTATDDYGGTVKSMSVKMATNVTHLLLAATWSDPSQSIRRVSGGPAAGSAYPGLSFANATIHGFDQFAVWWSLSQNPGPPPCMQSSAPGKGQAEALAGTGNLWRWAASSTDSGGFNFPTAKHGAGTPQAGHLINDTHSFARNLLLNTSGFFTLGFDSTNINATVGSDSSGVPYNS